MDGRGASGRGSRLERARVELLLTAERLFATLGLDNVSLRQIASEAGYANPATIQYHFGSKQGLYRAIVEYRTPGIDRRHAELLDEVCEIDAYGVAEVIARPLLEMGPTVHYAGFLGQLLVNFGKFPGIADALLSGDGSRRLLAAVDGLLPDISPGVRALRLQFATLLLVHAIANRRAGTDASPAGRLTEPQLEDELLAAMAAVLQPPGDHVVDPVGAGARIRGNR